MAAHKFTEPENLWIWIWNELSSLEEVEEEEEDDDDDEEGTVQEQGM